MSYYSSPSPQQQHPPPAPPPQTRTSHFSNMHPQHGGLYPATAAHLEHLQQQQQFAHFQQQQLAMGAQPIPLAPAMSQQAFTEEAMLAAQNMAAQNMAQTMAAQHLVPQNLSSQSVVAQNAADDNPSPSEDDMADLGGIGLQELLHGINPHMFGDLQTQAPDVIALLRKTNPLTGPSTSTQVPAINIAAAANSSAIDPDAITTSQIVTSSTMPRMSPHNVQPPSPTDAYPYLAGMVDASAPMMHSQLNVSTALGRMTTPIANGASRRTANERRANGGRTDTAAVAAAAAAAAASAAAAVGKTSRPRVGQKRSKAEQLNDSQRQTAVKQELTPMGGMYDPNCGLANAGGDIDLSEASENNEVRKAMRAERNRQSAAASRERKKNHIKELERRVTALSQQNAKLQVEQLDAIRTRIVKEQKLLDENKMLRKDGVMKDLKIHELTTKLEKAGLEPQPQRAAIQELNLRRPSTWGSSTWSASKWGLGPGTK